MIGVAKLLNDLSASGVLVTRRGDRLVLDGPADFLTESLIDQIWVSKVEILQEVDIWSHEDWQAFYDERAGIAEYDGCLLRFEAEAMAFEACIVEWLKRNPAPSKSGSCAHCGQAENDNAVVLPFGTHEITSTWLHSECWPDWHRERRKTAEEFLIGIGIG